MFNICCTQLVKEWRRAMGAMMYRDGRLYVIKLSKRKSPRNTSTKDHLEHMTFKCVFRSCLGNLTCLSSESELSLIAHPCQKTYLGCIHENVSPVSHVTTLLITRGGGFIFFLLHSFFQYALKTTLPRNNHFLLLYISTTLV